MCNLEGFGRERLLKRHSAALRKRKMFQTLLHGFLLCKPSMHGLCTCLNVTETISFLSFFLHWSSPTYFKKEKPQNFYVILESTQCVKGPQSWLGRKLWTWLQLKKKDFKYFINACYITCISNTAGENYYRNRVRPGRTESDLRLIVQ